MKRCLGQRRGSGGDHGLYYCSDRYLCCQWGPVVFCYGVGSNGEGEDGISVNVAVEFQFNGHHRIADTIDAEGSDRDAVNT